VQRIRVAVEVLEKGLHFDFDQGVDLRSGIVIQVDAHWVFLLSSVFSQSGEKGDLYE
jgi:hypothetical protein